MSHKYCVDNQDENMGMSSKVAKNSGLGLGGNQRETRSSKANQLRSGTSVRRGALTNITNQSNFADEDSKAKKLKTQDSNSNNIAVESADYNLDGSLATKVNHLNIGENAMTQQQPQPPHQSRTRHGGVANTSGRTIGSNLNEVDMENQREPLEVVDYIQDIVDHSFRVETKNMPNRHYMSRQRDINDQMRAILIDWLVEVHAKFRCVPEAIWLCVNILDRYLEQRQVAKSKLQLVGCVAMLIACKYEEIYPHDVPDFVHICDNAYTAEDILAMETTVLATLQYGITVPTAEFFIQRFVKIARGNTEMHKLTCYFSERTIQEYSFIKYRPSSIAAAALCLAIKTLNCQPGSTCNYHWTTQLEKHTRYSEKSIMPCVLDILRIVKLSVANQTQQKAVYKKYLSPKHGRVAAMQLPDLISSVAK